MRGKPGGSTRSRSSKPAVPARHGTIRRCAIYTRKSSEEGLEQAFNSLDAQREACEAYVTSQCHEGWLALPTLYDDGGFSGGSLERPALRQLLADIEAGRVDLVVVYKVDRLTRSLADFAKIVDVFDRQGASFVSVTQQFNTTTSMGRLTLNMLLSFAQFERDVTGERIRDKIAASKRKGMWMGGIAPLGYAVRDRKLVLVEGEAETVRHIFSSYLALGSVRLLQAKLAAENVVSKRRVGADGRPLGGKVITRGNLYVMLRNRLYRGEVAHNGACYPGEHPAIINAGLWDTVQSRLVSNGPEREAGRGSGHRSLLAGLLFDEAGERLVPTHASKAGRRYRYYISQSLLNGGRAAAPTGRRLPAHEVEQLVLGRLRQLFANSSELLGTARHLHLTPGQQQRLVDLGAELARGWQDLALERVRALLRASITRVEVHAGGVALTLLPSELTALLLAERQLPTKTEAATAARDGEHFIPDADQFIVDPPILQVAATLRRVGLEWRLVVDGPTAAPEPDATLVGLMRKAHALREAALRVGDGGLGTLAAQAGVTRSYYTRVLRLSFLAPDVVAAILDGRQPVGLTANKLLLNTRLPVCWTKQRAVLGFPTLH